MSQDSSRASEAANNTPVTDAFLGEGSSVSTQPSSVPPPPRLAQATGRGRRSAWPFVTVGVLVLASAGAAVLAIVEKGQGPSENNTALQSAVVNTVHSKTADIAMSLTISLGAGPGIKIEGNGATDLIKHATNLTMSLNVDGQALAERVVIDGSVGYVNLGPAVGIVVPGKSWVSEDEGSPTTGSSGVGSGGIFSDPSALIEVLNTEGTSVRACSAPRRSSGRPSRVTRSISGRPASPKRSDRRASHRRRAVPSHRRTSIPSTTGCSSTEQTICDRSAPWARSRPRGPRRKPAARSTSPTSAPA